ATFFIPGGAFGACGAPIQNSDFAVALPSANFAGGAHCGQTLTVNVIITLASIRQRCLLLT
ncbi:hypothetical protein B0H14DRAFT_2376547, partial [Mycena olivaceomarginata]